MESKNKFSLRRRVASFGYAFAGIRQMLQTQHNAWIHLAATVLVIIAAFVYQLSRAEWIAVIAAWKSTDRAITTSQTL